MTIAHISDMHFGKIAHPDIVESLVKEINSREIDLVVVSGDLTQRAFRRQFEAAAEMIEAISAPVLVVPGNHDVPAWWRPFSRLKRPLERYQRFITPNLRPTFESEGLAVMGINSAYGFTVKGGIIRHSDMQAMREFFCRQPEGTFKVLVVHHHLMRIKQLGIHDVAVRAKQALLMSADCDVELILCGHLHISHVAPKEIHPRGHSIVIASAGTATSSRGRRQHRKTNFYNLVFIEPESFTIEEQRFDIEERYFESFRMTRFNRASVV